MFCALCVFYAFNALRVSCVLNALRALCAFCVSVALCAKNAIYRYEIQPKCHFTALLSLKSYQKAEF